MIAKAQMTRTERMVWAAVFAREISVVVGGSVNGFEAARRAAQAVKILRALTRYRIEEDDDATAMLAEMTGGRND